MMDQIFTNLEGRISSVINRLAKNNVDKIKWDDDKECYINLCESTQKSGVLPKRISMGSQTSFLLWITQVRENPAGSLNSLGDLKRWSADGKINLVRARVNWDPLLIEVIYSHKDFKEIK